MPSPISASLLLRRWLDEVHARLQSTATTSPSTLLYFRRSAADEVEG